MNDLNPIHRAQKPFTTGRDLFKKANKESPLSLRVGNFVKATLLVIIGAVPFGISKLAEKIKNRKINEITDEVKSGSTESTAATATARKVNVVVLGTGLAFHTKLAEAIQKDHPDWEVQSKTEILRNVPEIGEPDILIVAAPLSGGRLVIRTDVQTDYQNFLEAAPLENTILVGETRTEDWANKNKELYDEKYKEVIDQKGNEGPSVRDFHEAGHFWSFNQTDNNLTAAQNAKLEETVKSLSQNGKPQRKKRKQ